VVPTALNEAKTERRHTRSRNGSTRLEIWQAESADGSWTYKREEFGGTPWVVIHNETGLTAGLHTSLPAAREATALGIALARLREEMAWRDRFPSRTA
jgi:hypothetical protein